jgi:hypothetical protein
MEVIRKQEIKSRKTWGKSEKTEDERPTMEDRR